jgi:predicted alpha/beta-hydrolase family hydrolase
MDFLWTGPARGKTLLLAHGSGAPMDSPFLETLARGLAKNGLRVGRFEFPYMQKRRETGGKRPPDTREKLLTSWREAFSRAKGPVVMAGKSLGGRIASYLADELGARALIAFGYPYHPPGRPEELRIEHLETLKTPALFLQGTRDVFGSPAEIEGYPLAPSIRLDWIPDGDHGYIPRVSSGRTEAQNLALAVEKTVDFLQAL